MKNTYHKFLRKLAHFQVEYPYLTVLLIIMITIALYGGVSKVRTVASLEQMMPQDINEIKAFNVLRDNHLGQDVIAIILQQDRDSTLGSGGIVDMRDKRIFDYISKIKPILENEPDVIAAYAYSDVVMMNANGPLSDLQYNKIMSNKNVNPFLSNYISSNDDSTIIMIMTDVSADDSRMNLLSTKIKGIISSYGHPPGIKITLTGTPIIQQKLGNLIAHDRKKTQNISTLFVFIITMLLFGTFTSALVPIIIVTISVNWLYGIMGYAGLPISTLAGGVAAMIIGIGIDYAIHLMNKFKNERGKGNTIKESIETAIENTGTALTGAAIATIVAFLAFLMGRMPEMNRFGLLMAIGVSASFILTLFGLPALLIIEEQIIHIITKRMKFGVEGELMLSNKQERCPAGYKMVKAKEIRYGQRILVKEQLLNKIKFDKKKYRK